MSAGAVGVLGALGRFGVPAVDPTPAPTPVQEINLDTTGGGGSHSFEFFVVSFLLALACVAIAMLLARQLRRMNRNYQDRVDAGELPDERRPTFQGTGEASSRRGAPGAPGAPGASGPSDDAGGDR
ncbi:hypothetical protein [Luteimicrobium subarcticum]|uniref:Uncharacterized protein n=1 Tax=Luteimicrobium subarcticum TaxID=620910 RepID=A0A2M8WTH0_9MICO|nr:hypothetical protein [Luteimicrobium subarcticum]PJI94174.1 hypothetical protein CLV34_1661 [Luteimicrobium subarcticum]